MNKFRLWTNFHPVNFSGEKCSAVVGRQGNVCASGNLTELSWEAGYLIICHPIASKSISDSVCSEGGSMANQMEGGRIC